MQLELLSYGIGGLGVYTLLVLDALAVLVLVAICAPRSKYMSRRHAK